MKKLLLSVFSRGGDIVYEANKIIGEYINRLCELRRRSKRKKAK